MTAPAATDDGPVTCSCGRVFKDSEAIWQHRRDARVHQGDRGNKAVAATAKAVETETEGEAHPQAKVFRALTLLRNAEAFPTYHALPDEFGLDPSYYNMASALLGLPLPRRHWCFLAEIVDTLTRLRVYLGVKDKAGYQVRLAFHTDARGFEVKPSLLQPGHTVAVMYAEQHRFLDGTVGIRLEDISNFKVIPMGLQKLLALSDRMPEYLSEENDVEKKCRACGRCRKDMLKCGGCMLFRYCNKACQIHGWKEKGHKQECPVLRDKELQSLLLMDRNKVGNFVSFSG